MLLLKLIITFIFLTIKIDGLSWDTPTTTSTSNQKGSKNVKIKYGDKNSLTSSIEESWREQQEMTSNKNDRNNNYDNNDNNNNNNQHHEREIYTVETKQKTSNMKANNNINTNNNDDNSRSSTSSTISDLCYDSNEEFEPLKVLCEVNGFVIPAIIDTGAQITVMSHSCAKRCRIHSNIDKRFAGKAFGIGSSDILGRIDGLNMRVGPVSFQSRISILNNAGVDFLIGLDFLKRFRCEINMKENTLILQVREKRIRVPFGNSSRYNYDRSDDEAKIIGSDLDENSSQDVDKLQNQKRTYSENIDYSDDETTFDSPLSMEGV